MPQQQSNADILLISLSLSLSLTGDDCINQNLLDWADNRRYVQSADVKGLLIHQQKERKPLGEDLRIWLFSDRIIIGQLKEEYYEGEPEFTLIDSMDLLDVHVELLKEKKDKEDKADRMSHCTALVLFVIVASRLAESLTLLLLVRWQCVLVIRFSFIPVPTSHVTRDTCVHGALFPRAGATHVDGVDQQEQDADAR
jgi:hypothetical protein